MRMGNILVVEDEESQQDIFRIILQSKGYGAEIVGNGTEALKCVSDALSLNRPFDLIIMDLRLPDIDGFDLLERLLAIEPHLCIIVITAYGSIESAVEAMKRGAFTGADQRRVGLFEVADKSTLFLDEIGDLAPPMQAKLLRTLQERTIRRLGGREEIKIDVRVIAATNSDLNELMRQGRFREDLYWRLHVIAIHLPLLRERATDIPELVEYFIAKFAGQREKPVKGISNEAFSVLMAYDWPGNIRQLESAIERAIILMEGDTIQVGDLPPEIKSGVSRNSHAPIHIPDEGISFYELERDLIHQAMEKSDWVISKAARLLGMSYRTLQYRLEKFQLKKNGQ